MGIKERGCHGADWVMWLRIGSRGRLLEHGNELSGSIKGGEFNAQLEGTVSFRRTGWVSSF